MKNTNLSLEPKVKVNETFSTDDYNLFKRLEGNRVLNMVHVKRLEESIAKNGMLQIDIIVNENFQVIDGQNRLQAARNAKSIVYYKVCRGYGLKEAQILNENVKTWRKIDYLDSYCELGYGEYVKFKKFMNDFPYFNFSSCEKILQQISSYRQDTVGGERTTSKYFETGNLYIPNLKESYVIAGKMLDIKPYFEGYNNTTFVSAMLSIFRNKEYDHGEFIRKLQTRGSARLEFCQNMEQYKLLIEEIYNFRRQGSKINLRY
ncbi:MAG: hypothetical protein LLG05_14110 [Porphyromonadaceae bacterium]|nr:hypothetical protein [Porphyromonadaceae bacterium]